jgi:phospholipid transport system substrate-binding protein
MRGKLSHIPRRLHLVVLAFAASFVLMIGPGAASARQASDPTSFVTGLAQEALDDLASVTIPERERIARFRTLFNDCFDVPMIARFVLGRYWRQASEAERAEYVRLFDELVVQTYSRRFNEFNTARIRALNASKPNEDNDVIVAIEGAVANKPPVRLDVRVRQTGKEYKVIDVALEGVSMAITQRDEFASVIQRGGGRVEALLANLREKVGQR